MQPPNTYVVYRHARDARHMFTQRVGTSELGPVGKKRAEYLARQVSRAHPHQLTTLVRASQIVAFMMNGRAFPAHVIIADAAGNPVARKALLDAAMSSPTRRALSQGDTTQ